MNITRDNTGELTAEIKISIAEDDYKVGVDKAIKDYQKKASFKGFRPGKVPSSLIQKLYGKSILAEEVNKILNESLTKYIKDNNINILGQPLPVDDKNKNPDFENQKEFDFYFEIGLSPDFNMDLLENIELPYNEIEITELMVEKEIKYLQKRFGNYLNPETIEGKDIVSGKFEELDENGNVSEAGINHKANVALEHTKNSILKEKLTGAAKNDIITLSKEDILFNEDEALYYLHIKKEDIPNIKSSFRFTIEEIKRVEPAELNADFFQKVYPNSDIVHFETFTEKVKADYSQLLKSDCDTLLNKNIVEYLTNNIKFELPEDFLKRWLAANNEKLTENLIEKEFSNSISHIKWEIIENKIIKDNNIDVNNDEFKEYAKNHARNQLINYGLPIDMITDEYLETFYDDMVKKEETVRNIYNNIYNTKVINFIKSKIKIINNKITFDEFLKLKHKKTEDN